MNYIENKQIVLPGSLLSDDKIELGRGTYRENGKIYSSIKGLVYFQNDLVSVIPFNYTYTPQYGDLVIGRVINCNYSSWSIDINTTYHGFLPTSELYNKYEQNINNIININDLLLLRINNIDEIKRLKLTLRAHGLGKFNEGIIIKVKQPTVHFLSEENAFITPLLQEYTKSDIIVGKNGIIWINGLRKNVEKVLKVIDIIEHNPCEHNLGKIIQNRLVNPHR